MKVLSIVEAIILLVLIAVIVMSVVFGSSIVVGG